jgi:hypothetical protein
MRMQMKEQIDYTAVSQTRVLAILAAIYLPFSFIAVSRVLLCGPGWVVMVFRVCSV